MFNNDVNIIDFLTSEGYYEEQIIDEHEHDLKINHKQDTKLNSKIFSQNGRSLWFER